MSDPVRSPRLDPLALGPARNEVPDGLAGLAGPLFDVRVGTVPARLVKRVLNAVLVVPTRPQKLFNDALRGLLGRWALIVHELMDGQGVLAAELETQRGDLARLAAEVAALRGGPSPILPRVALGEPATGCWHAGTRSDDGVDVVTSPARLPFRADVLEEVVVPAALARHADARWLADWRAALRTDGRLRCTPPLGDADELVAILAEAGFDGLALEQPVRPWREPSLVARRGPL